MNWNLAGQEGVPMSDDFLVAMTRLAGRLSAAFNSDPELRAALRGVANSIIGYLDRTESQPASPASNGAASHVQTQTAPTAPPAPSIPAAPSEPPVPTVLRLGDAERPVLAKPGAPEPAWMPRKLVGPTVVEPAPEYPGAGGAVIDPPLLAKRFDLKSRACRWVNERRRRIAAGEREADLAPASRAYFDEAKELSRCYLWMMDPYGPPVPGEIQLADLAGAYECCAKALDAYLHAAESEKPGTRAGDALARTLFLLAESQSSLRAGLAGVDDFFQDFDQRGLFDLLKRQAYDRQVYIPRHMTLQDPADPRDWLDLLRRINDLRNGTEKRSKDESQRQSLLNKAKYHAKRLADAKPGDESWAGDWHKLAGAIEILVGHGLPPSDTRLRELLLPLYDDLPDEADADASLAVKSVFDEVERYLASQVEVESALADQPRRRSPSVAAARELLRGRTVVMVGGYPRNPQAKKIEEAFELAELRWISALHHQSLEEVLLPQLSRPEVSVILILTKWRSHQFGPQARQWCKQQHKSFIELPGGYGVEQVAHQVLLQASEELKQTGEAVAV